MAHRVRENSQGGFEWDTNIPHPSENNGASVRITYISTKEEEEFRKKYLPKFSSNFSKLVPFKSEVVGLPLIQDIYKGKLPRNIEIKKIEGVFTTKQVQMLEVKTAFVQDTQRIENIEGYTRIVNNGEGERTYSDIVPSIWDVQYNRMLIRDVKLVLDVQLRFTLRTNTLGGIYEIQVKSLFNDRLIDSQKEAVEVQNQTYTIDFRIVTTIEDTKAGIGFYIEPEEGMSLTMYETSFIFVRL